jgi:hypothetical protein
MVKNSKDKKEMRSLAKDIMECERELQKLWKFHTVDDRFIKFWLLPKCECPCYDNEDNYPSGQFYIKSSCPLHGA